MSIPKINLIIFAVFLQCSFSANVLANDKLALVIGINEYVPQGKGVRIKNRNWQNLDGAVNDALGIKSMIISRFGFKKPNVKLLLNQEASRAAIFDQLDQLVKKAKSGDQVFIYYAGHGSQVFNSKSANEDDKFDESIIPADAYAGADDIRDKELNKYFSALGKKGVRLTVIFDSCNSGSVTRGGLKNREFKSRYLLRDGKDAADPTVPEDLTALGALVISSTQDYQYAKEFIDENNTSHGAFTYALLKAMQSSSSMEPSVVLIQKVRAIMEYNGVAFQYPVIEGPRSRLNASLFGDHNDGNNGQTFLTLIKEENGEFILEGGHDLGISAGCVLENYKNTALQLQVTEVVNLVRCKAKVKEGSLISKVNSGDVFKVISWVEVQNPSLLLWGSESTYENRELVSLYQQVASLQEKFHFSLLEDYQDKNLTHIIDYNEGKWEVYNLCGQVVEIGENITEEGLREGLSSVVLEDCSRQGKSLGIFLNLPMSKNLSVELKKALDLKRSAVRFTEDARKAHYCLAGRIQENELAYSWVNPQISEDTAVHYLPLKTKWVKSSESSELVEQSRKLGKIRAWFVLDSPPNEANFPYSLSLKNANTGKLLRNGTAMNGEIYGLVLNKDPEKMALWNRENRFVYVYSMDKEGQIQLLFPSMGGNVENSLENIGTRPGIGYMDEIKLGPSRLFRVTAPFGMDHYIFITSSQPLPAPNLLEQEGVTRSMTQSPDSLFNLLDVTGNATLRTVGYHSAPNWSIEKLHIRSVSR
ncbi:caspase family protein [Flexithrix dorotheae]|uniref:caspase family protein n=1 Tax=Flexithrix dorotheae TaxID=70993 RepID=UPI0003788C3D|nr:caspase family protein [Flexithrix dorotheae]